MEWRDHWNSRATVKRLLADNFEELHRTATVVAKKWKASCWWVIYDDLYQECWHVFGLAARTFKEKEGTVFPGYAQSAAYRSLTSFVLRESSPVPNGNMREMKKIRRKPILGHSNEPDPKIKKVGVVLETPAPDYAELIDRTEFHWKIASEIWRLIVIVAKENAIDRQTVMALALKEETPKEVAECLGLDPKLVSAVARKTRDMIASDPKVGKLWREA